MSAQWKAPQEGQNDDDPNGYWVRMSGKRLFISPTTQLQSLVAVAGTSRGKALYRWLAIMWFASSPRILRCWARAVQQLRDAGAIDPAIAYFLIVQIAKNMELAQAAQNPGPTERRLLRRLQTHPAEPNPGDHAPAAEREEWLALRQYNEERSFMRLAAIFMDWGEAALAEQVRNYAFEEHPLFREGAWQLLRLAGPESIGPSRAAS
jgi:hypothetical protein